MQSNLLFPITFSDKQPNLASAAAAVELHALSPHNTIESVHTHVYKCIKS